MTDMARYIDADNFRKTMIKRFGGIPCLTDYSEASRYDIPLDDALDLAPTADVVPKSEVEKLEKEFDELAEEHSDLIIEKDHLFDEAERLTYLLHCYALQYGTVRDQQAVIDKAKAEVAREIFEGLENILDAMIKLNHGIGINHADYLEQEKAIAAKEALRAFRDYVAELKKKYQEGEPNG